MALLIDPVRAPFVDLIAALFSDLMRQIYKGFSEVGYARIIPMRRLAFTVARKGPRLFICGPMPVFYSSSASASLRTGPLHLLLKRFGPTKCFPGQTTAPVPLPAGVPAH